MNPSWRAIRGESPEGDPAADEAGQHGSRRRGLHDRAVLRYVCQRAFGTAAYGQLAQAARERTGGGLPSLDLFAEVYPGFHVRLAATRLKAVVLPTIADLYARPTNTAIHRAWREAQAEIVDRRPLALVFPWPSAHKAFGVLHTVDYPAGVDGRRFSYKVGGRTGDVFVLEPLAQLLDYLYPPDRPR